MRFVFYKLNLGQMYLLFIFSKTIQKWVLTILGRDKLLAARKPDLLKAMSKAFDSFSQNTETVFDELMLLVEDDPQLIADSTRFLCDNKAMLNKMIESQRNQKNARNKTVIDKISGIADMYEAVYLLRFPAYLISKRKADFKKLEEPNAILSHFKFAGITTQFKDQLRIVRNAKSHSYEIENDCIVNNKGEKITVKEIEELHEKFELVFSWWLTFVAFSLWFYLKFAVVVVLAIYSSISKNAVSWEAFGKGITIFYSDMIEERNEAKAKEEPIKKNNILDFFKRIKIPFWKKATVPSRKHTKTPMIIENLPTIIDGLEFQLASVINDLMVLEGKLEYSEDQVNIRHFTEWLVGTQKKIKDAKLETNMDPGKLHDFLLNEF